jgi:16S rRNA (cytidine1402-2'-O)-methyltransferase
MGVLYLVATPIGNLEDISPRALRILREVTLIAAEDTRVTGKLLSRYGIETRLLSYYEHNKAQRIDAVLDALAEGDVALVSDAGTPAINDPGYELVRRAVAAGIRVSPVPGPSAPIAALAASGLPANAFLYLGYLPRKAKERRAALEAVAEMPYTLIFLETPHRLLRALADMEASLGDRDIAVARELTKLHEEIFRGKISAARAHFEAYAPRGEFTLVVAGKREEKTRWSESEVLSEIDAALAEGESPSAAAKRLARESGWSRRDIYRILQEKNQNSSM